MGCITNWNQCLNSEGGGIPSSKLKNNFENKRIATVFATKLAVQLRIESFGEDNAFTFLVDKCNKGKISFEDTEQIFDECF
jgi:hypothetical protein